jgi:uncharacterized protein HemX
MEDLMDPNNKPTETPVGVPIQPAGGVSREGLPPILPPESTNQSGGSKKMLIVIIVLLTITILGAGAYYFYTIQNQPTTDNQVPVEKDPELTQLQDEAENIQIPDLQEEMTALNEEIDLIDASSSASPSATPGSR